MARVKEKSREARKVKDSVPQSEAVGNRALSRAVRNVHATSEPLRSAHVNDSDDDDEKNNDPSEHIAGDRYNDYEDSDEKDEVEEELERLVFGDSAGFREGVRNFTAGAQQTKGSKQDGLGEEQDRDEGGLEGLADADVGPKYARGGFPR